MNLKEFAKTLTNSLPIMEDREKENLCELYGEAVKILDFGYLKDKDGKEFVCFIIEQRPQKFYFAGQVLTDMLQRIEQEGYKEELQKEGFWVKLEEKKSGNNRNYTAVNIL